MVGGGGYFLPPRISEATRRIRKMQTVFDGPAKTVGRNLISLTLESPITSQVRSKIKCLTVHGFSMDCVSAHTGGGDIVPHLFFAKISKTAARGAAGAAKFRVLAHKSRIHIVCKF